MTYVIRTPNGYVGRLSLSAPLTDDQPAQFAYVYPDRGEAERVAQGFEGATVEAL